MDKNNLADIKEEVYKCSKCALCKSVCPVFLATKNEMYLPRGRFIILNNFFNYNKKLSANFIKDLDKCLNCNLCKDFCPSAIDSAWIYTRLKREFGFKYSFLPFSVVFKLKMYLSFIKSIFYPRERVKKIENSNQDKIVYFEGCINRYVNPSDRNAVVKILSQLGYSNIKIYNNCCGLPYLSDGETERFRLNALKIMNTIPDDTKYIICSCDSCYETLKKVLQGSSLYNKLITFDEFLKINKYPIKAQENVLYHRPLIRRKEVYLGECGIKEINKKNNCTLMENFLLMKNKDFAKSIMKYVRYPDEETRGKTIITTCQLSKIGLEKAKYQSRIMTYAEYISKISK